MAEFPTYDEVVKGVAERALDEFLYQGKSIREWVKIITEQEPCDDAISREEVLRELKGCLTGGETEYQYVKLHIDSIPSVNLQEPYKDTVSREDANKLLDIISFLMEIIRELQSDKREPKTGHWKLVQRGKSIDICCSNCEKVRIKQYAYNYTIDQLDKEDLEECFKCADMRYCPNCGVKMESEVEE